MPSSPAHAAVEARGHVTDEQRAVSDALAVSRLPHELLVDVVAREVAGDAGEEVDVGLSDGLVDFDLSAYGERGERFLGGRHGRLLERRHDSPARCRQRARRSG